jgi:MtrB/PioB family decaheme-associated outer membrane protein
MNTHRQTAFALPAMLVLFVTAAGTAYAADGEVVFGTEGWNQTTREAKYEEFHEYPRGPFIESFLLTDDLAKGRYTVVGVHGLMNDQATDVTYRKPRWTAGVEYRRTPHNFSFLAATPYTESARGVLVLPDTLQRRVQENPANQATNTLLDLTRNAHHTQLGFRTDRLTGRVKGRFSQGLQLDLRGTRRQRDGTKAYGGSFGFNNAVEITEPIHQTMLQGEARVSYVKRHVSLEARGGAEAFMNDADALVFDNPRRYTDSPTLGSSRGRTDLYPENRTLRGTLQAGVQLPHRTALTAVVGVSDIRQDDKWLPFTINRAILQPDTFPLPGTSTNAKATVLTSDVRLTGSPLRLVSGTLRFRRYDYDNKTKQYVIPGQVAYDQTWQPAAVETHPTGYINTVYGADVDVKPTSRVTLFGTAEHIRRERTFREVAADEEWAFEGKARVRPREGIDLEGRYRQGDRKLDHFEEEDYQNDAGVFVEQPTLRRFDVGDRQQRQARGSVGWIPNDRLQISAVYEWLRNKYENEDLPGIDAPLVPDTTETQLGLLDETRRNISADASYQFSPRIEVGASYGWTQVYTNQRSRESNSASVRLDDSTTWQARLKDWFTYATGHVGWSAIPNRLSILGTYTFERSPGVYHLTNYRNTAIDLPTTKYQRQIAGGEAWYTFNPGTSIGARYSWEEFVADDFAMEDVPLLFPTTGTSNAIFLGDSINDYHAHLVALLVRKSF